MTKKSLKSAHELFEYIEQLQQQIMFLKAEVIEADHDGFERGYQEGQKGRGLTLNTEESNSNFRAEVTELPLESEDREWVFRLIDHAYKQGQQDQIKRDAEIARNANAEDLATEKIASAIENQSL